MNLKAVFLFFILFFSVYQDFPLINRFGEIARSPIVFLTPILILYLVKDEKLKISNYSKYFLLYVLYLVLITVIHVLWIIIVKSEIFFLGENIIVKSMKMAIYPIVALIYYQFIYTFLSKDDSRFEILFRAIFALEIFLVIYMIFEIHYSKTLDVFMSFLHSNEKKYWRVRLLTLEESWIGSILTIISFVTIYLSNYLNKSKATKLLVYFTSIFFIIYYTIQSESKGYMLILLVSTLPLIIKFLYQNKKTRKYLAIGGLAIFVFGIYVFLSLQSVVLDQFYTSITFGTRFSSYLASLRNFIHHPLGVGYGPYLVYYVDSLKEITESSIMSSFELNEVKGYLETSKNLSTKTYFFDNLVFGGVSFLLFFYLFFIRRYFAFSKMIYPNLTFIKIPLIYVILSSLLYITFINKYEIWFFLAFIDVLRTKLIIKENE